MKTEKHRTPYIPALRFHWLTPLYDPLLRWMLRESVWAGPAAPERFTLPRAAAAHLPPTDRPLDELPPGHWPEGVVPRQRRPS